MAHVVTDLYSVIRLRDDDRYGTSVSSGRTGRDTLSLLQSLVIADSVVIDGRRAPQFHLPDFCTRFEGVFRLRDLGDLWDANALESVRVEAKAPIVEPFLLGGLAYLKVAQQLGIYLLVHPSRSPFLDSIGCRATSLPAAEVAILEFEKHLARAPGAEYAAIDFSVPPVAEHLLWLQKTQHIDVATAVNELRNSKNARRFRKYAADLDVELSSFSPRASIAPLQRLVREVQEVANVWSKDLNADIKHVRRRISLRKLWGIGPLLESLGVDGFEVKGPVLIPKKPHLLFLNDLYQFGSRGADKMGARSEDNS